MGAFLKGPGHTQRVAVNGNAGAVVSVDFTAVPTTGTPWRIVPWGQVSIRPATGAVRCAWYSGEIEAGRYFVIPAGAVRDIEGPNSSPTLYMLMDGVGADTVEVEVFE